MACRCFFLWGISLSMSRKWLITQQPLFLSPCQTTWVSSLLLLLLYVRLKGHFRPPLMISLVVIKAQQAFKNAFTRALIVSLTPVLPLHSITSKAPLYFNQRFSVYYQAGPHLVALTDSRCLLYQMLPCPVVPLHLKTLSLIATLIETQPSAPVCWAITPFQHPSDPNLFRLPVPESDRNTVDPGPRLIQSSTEWASEGGMMGKGREGRPGG